MDKKIIILIAVIIVLIGGLILYRNYINPYSSGQADNAGGASQSRPADNEVIINDFEFSPASLTVSIGAEVTWTQEELPVHQIISDTGAFQSGDLVKGDKFKFVFIQSGEYLYHCGVHPSMKGKIIVQ